MKAPIPSSNSSWWNDTDGQLMNCFCSSPKKMPYQACKEIGCESQCYQWEKWWTDAMLDEKASELLAHHARRGPAAPWFMKTAIMDKSEFDADAPWLSESEIEELDKDQQCTAQCTIRDRLDRGEQFTIDGRLCGGIKVPKALLISFSRRVKESNQYFKRDSRHMPLDYDFGSWHFYLRQFWAKGQVDEEWLEWFDMDTVIRTKEQMGTPDQLMKATATFFEWMKTGKVVLEVDEFVNKTYLLKVARGLGAPLFRAAILEQLQSPSSSQSLPQQAASSNQVQAAEELSPEDARTEADRVRRNEKKKAAKARLKEEKKNGEVSLAAGEVQKMVSEEEAMVSGEGLLD